MPTQREQMHNNKYHMQKRAQLGNRPTEKAATEMVATKNKQTDIQSNRPNEQFKQQQQQLQTYNDTQATQANDQASEHTTQTSEQANQGKSEHTDKLAKQH